MTSDIVNDFRKYAADPARWVNRYLNQCSPKVSVLKVKFHLTEEELQIEDNKKPRLH